MNGTKKASTKKRPAKAGTKDRWRQVGKDLVDFFGGDKLVVEVTTGDAIDWRHWLLQPRKLGENTVRKQTGIARQFFNRAMKDELVTRNPFIDSSELPTAVKAGGKVFVTREMTNKLLDQCPDNKWRLVVALVRYCGLRPSEVNILRWDDILWDQERIAVRSPKTEHHEGKEQRTIPMWLELKPFLERAFDEASEGEKYVAGKGDYRTHIRRLIIRAGMQPWPRLFTSMRSSRQTELMDSRQVKESTVCYWMGNSKAVSKKHYEQITDLDYDRALGLEPASDGAKLEPAPSDNDRQGAIRGATKHRKRRCLSLAGIRCGGVELSR